MNDAVLMKIGLTKTEAKLYLLLLELGSTSVGPVVKKSGLHRATVYDVLERLLEKGIVSFIIKDSKKFYEAEEPENIKKILEGRKADVEKEIVAFDAIIPELNQIRSLAENREEAHIMRGSAGLFSLIRDMVREKAHLYVFGAQGIFMDKFRPIADYYIRERKKQRIKQTIIYSESMRGIRTKKELPLADWRFIPREYDSPATIWIYGDKVAITLWTDKPLVVMINNKKIRESYIKFFNLMWNVSKP
jgi:HTH-type transcriptional regulator, sugar sensing transcriptional regulator